MELTESAVLRELSNIVRGEPLWPGDTLSHATANICVRRGWADRNSDGCFVATNAERRRARRPVRCLSMFKGVQCAHGDGHSGPHEYVEAF